MEVCKRGQLCSAGVGCARQRARVCLKQKLMHKKGPNRNTEKDRGETLILMCLKPPELWAFESLSHDLPSTVEAYLNRIFCC